MYKLKSFPVFRKTLSFDLTLVNLKIILQVDLELYSY